MSDNSLVEVIACEMHDAYAELRTIHHIRVTADVVPGSVVAAPITPERARQIRLRAFPGADESTTVDVDPELVVRPLLELLIHPEDWGALLKEFEGVISGQVTSVMGIPVVE